MKKNQKQREPQFKFHHYGQRFLWHVAFPPTSTSKYICMHPEIIDLIVGRKTEMFKLDIFHLQIKESIHNEK